MPAVRPLRKAERAGNARYTASDLDPSANPPDSANNSINNLRDLEDFARLQFNLDDLPQQEKLDSDGFTKFYAPLEERRKQLEVEIPRLEAQVDILKVNHLLAAEIASEQSV